MTRFTRQAERGHDGLAHEAVLHALSDAGLHVKDIEAAFCGTVAGGSGTGQRCLKDLGFGGIPITNIENACASSTSAMIEALAWIAAGFCDVALVLGVEILSSAPKGPLQLPEGNWLFDSGMNLPMWYAMQARRHMAVHGLTLEQLAAVAVKSRALGALNSRAHFQQPATLDEVLHSRTVASPLTLFQCCPKTDGAAALIVASGRYVRERGLAPVWIRSHAIGSGNPVYVDTPSHTSTAARVAKEALERAGIAPADLDVVELHDAFSIGEILYTEALGLCPPGTGGVYAASGDSMPGSPRTAVNPSGGLLSRGHPLGASGLAMVHEVVTQLRGAAGRRQKSDARLGATHTMGANEFELDGNVCTVLVFEGDGT